ncbi:MAG TPA: copper resistance protein CopC [Aquihabitans sp.]|jgi:copper transport protein|nr:copper resistance protein CopC [Aquihabitans sp.]
MRVTVRLLGALLAALALALVPAGPASAHAELSTSDPADGSVVDVAPSEVTIRFTEGVSVRPDGVRVLDGDGDRVDAGTATASGDTVVAPLDGALPDGGYVVAWRIVSADGHPVRGAFTFSVGQQTDISSGVVDEAFGDSADGRDDLVASVLRAVAYLGILGATGLVLVGAAVRRPDEPAPVGRVATALAGVALVAVLAQVPVQASLVTGRGWGSVTEEGVLALALADGVGWSIGLTVAGLVALLVTAGLPFTGPARALAIGGSVLAPLGLVVTGHTRTMSPAAVGFAADGAHVLAGAVWFGGLFALLVAVRRRRAQGDVRGAGEAVARFSGWAGLTAAAVAVSGTTLAWIEVGGLEALTTTTYGRLLMAKVGLVALVAAGAAWNRFRLVPAISGDRDGDGSADPAWGALSGVVRFELVALVAVLALTSVLANETPARSAVAAGTQTASAPLGEGTVEVVVDPARPGRNDVHAYLLDADGGPDDRFEDARFELALPAQDLGPFEREPVRAGPGHFQLVGTDLDLAGEWALTVTVQPDRFTEQTATVRFRIR